MTIIFSNIITSIILKNIFIFKLNLNTIILLSKNIISLLFLQKKIKPQSGFEPETSCLQGKRSNQLSYNGS